jgi:ribosomal protein S21
MRVNAEIILSPGQDAEQACKQLKKALAKVGMGATMRRHAFHMKPGERKRFKSAKARRRARKDGYHPYEAKHLAYLDRYGLPDDPRRAADRR